MLGIKAAKPLLLFKIIIVKYSFILLLSLFCFSLSAQSANPVTWEAKVVANDNGTFDLVVDAIVEKGWSFYSQHTGEDGPIPTYFEITSENVELIGDFKELTEPKKGMDDMFGVEVIKFSKNAQFVQSFKTDSTKKIEGNVTFMTCDDKRCLPPVTVDFSAEF